MSTIKTDLKGEIQKLIEATWEQTENELGCEGGFKELLQEYVGMPDGSNILLETLYGLALAINPAIDLEYIEPFLMTCHYMHRASLICDDIVDADKDNSLPGKYGNSRSLLIGLVAWWLTERQLARFAYNQKCGHNTSINVLELVDYIHKSLLLATRGQFEETDRPEKIISIAECLERVAAKSGLFTEMVFKVTALAAGAGEEEAGKYGEVGYRLGLITQLAGDLVSCYDPNSRRNSIACRHFSLPVAYALTHFTLKDEITRLWHSVQGPVIVHESPGDVEIDRRNNNKRLLHLIEEAGGMLSTILLMHQVNAELEALLNVERECYNKPQKEELNQAVLNLARRHLKTCAPLLRASITETA
ncbi:MAG TPA: class 1 isoprenoid biosynthesis enzyme [Chloroflexia bacterium]|nr:class 1 isoprenoid biosynthesis enzyme [Chloroflexia bacterium]